MDDVAINPVRESARSVFADIPQAFGFRPVLLWSFAKLTVSCNQHLLDQFDRPMMQDQTSYHRNMFLSELGSTCSHSSNWQTGSGHGSAPGVWHLHTVNKMVTDGNLNHTYIHVYQDQGHHWPDPLSRYGEMFLRYSFCLCSRWASIRSQNRGSPYAFPSSPKSHGVSTYCWGWCNWTKIWLSGRQWSIRIQGG